MKFSVSRCTLVVITLEKSTVNNELNKELHETCKCECKFGANICNTKQRWNNGKCRCKYKEWIYKEVCDKGFIWNPSNCECECNKACHVGEYLDYENCTCGKKIVDKLVKECTETVEEVKLAKNENKHKCSSCTLYIVLIILFFTNCTGIATYFVYYNWSLVKNVSCIKFNTRTQTTI